MMINQIEGIGTAAGIFGAINIIFCIYNYEM